MRTLRVGINLLWCRPRRVGGVEEHVTRQLVGLAGAAPEIEGTLIVPPGFREAHPGLASSFRVIEGPIATRWLVGRLVEEVRWLPEQVHGLDIVHHGNGTVPPGSRGPVALSIHDLQFMEYPEYFSLARRTYLRQSVPRSARSASVIIVPTDFVRRTVIDALPVHPDRVVVVPHGYDPPAPESRSIEELVRERYGLGERRVLVYPAATYPHKRHDFLLQVLAGPLSDPDIVLVLLGGPGRADAAVTHGIASLGVRDRVVRAGRVPEADRDALIGLAEALVFPSEYEGFGVPVLEAMALGTPVVCSDRGSLPEVVGDAAIVAPLNLEAWADALARLPSRRDELVARGLKRASAFTTRAAGASLAAAYRAALS